MSEHWNVQLSVQKVTETPEEDAIKRFSQGRPPIRKTTLQLVDIKVQTETEAEAFEGVKRLLVAVHPQALPILEPRFGPAPRPIRDDPQA